MSAPEPAPPERSGSPVVPIFLAVGVAAGALVALYLYGEPQTAERPLEPAADRAMAASPKRAHVPGIDAEGIETMAGLPGYGSYEGVSFSARAQSLAAEQSVEALMARLQNAPAGHADFAGALALKQMNGEGDRGEINRSLAPLAKHTDPNVRRSALAGLSNGGDEGLTAMATALEALGNGDIDPQAQQDLIAAIGQLGPEAERAIDILANRLRHSEDPSVQKSAAEALGGIGPTAEESLRTVRRDLKTDELSRAENAQLLEQLNGILEQLDQIEGFERR